MTTICLDRNISKTDGYRDSVPMDHQEELAYWPSNGHMTEKNQHFVYVLYNCKTSVFVAFSCMPVSVCSDILNQCAFIVVINVSIYVNNFVDRPGLFDLKGKAKWDAWESRKGAELASFYNSYLLLVL